MLSRFTAALLLPFVLWTVGCSGDGGDLTGEAGSRYTQSTKYPLPVDVSGTTKYGNYGIKAPANWNGTLLVYLHGYQRADLPAPPLSLVPPVVAGGAPALQAELLAQGYALVAGDFGDRGWAIDEAMDSAADLVKMFEQYVAEPTRAVLWGTSLGGLTVLKMMEKNHNHRFAAGLAMCPPAAGAPRRFDRSLDLSLAYAAMFGWPASWGTPGDLRDDLKFNTEVMPILMTQLPGPATMGKWEFMRMMYKVSQPEFYGVDPLTGQNFFAADAWFAFGARAELEARAGGPVAQNVGTTYSLAPAQIGALAYMGVDANAALAFMNANANIVAPEDPRQYLVRFADPTGQIDRPLVTMHNTVDGVAPVAHESAFRATVEAAGSLDNVAQAYVNGLGHCAFTGPQLLAGLGAVNGWLDTGIKPAVFDPALGFNNAFVPPAW